MTKTEKFKFFFNIIAPFVLPMIPGIGPAAGIIIHAVNTAEDLGGSGASKKDIAMSLVTDGINSTNIIAGKTIIDPSTVAVVGTVIDNVITNVNALSNSVDSTTPVVIK
jgi:hypothetical protein